MPVSDRIKVFIVDDHPAVRHGIAQCVNLEEDMRVCGEAGDSAAAKEALQSLQPDIILVDLSLKWENQDSGLELIQYLTIHYPGTPVLALSMHDRPRDIQRSVQAGARGYFHKGEPVNRYPVAIRKIVNGETYFSEIIAHILVNQITAPPAGDDFMKHLSQRDRDIFLLLGQGLRRQPIAERLNISPKTVSAHIENLKEKTAMPTTEALVQFAVDWFHKHGQ
ncbi:MAG: response regulator [bacterium]